MMPVNGTIKTATIACIEIPLSRNVTIIMSTMTMMLPSKMLLFSTISTILAILMTVLKMAVVIIDIAIPGSSSFRGPSKPW